MAVQETNGGSFVWILGFAGMMKIPIFNINKRGSSDFITEK